MVSHLCFLDDQEVYILGDFKINLFNNQKHTPNGNKRYKEFCSLNGLKQLINLLTRVIENSGAVRYILFCGPMFVPSFVSSQPNSKVK